MSTDSTVHGPFTPVHTAARTFIRSLLPFIAFSPGWRPTETRIFDDPVGTALAPYTACGEPPNDCRRSRTWRGRNCPPTPSGTPADLLLNVGIHNAQGLLPTLLVSAKPNIY